MPIKKTKVRTPSLADAKKRIVEISGLAQLIAEGILTIKGELAPGRGFLVRVRPDGGEWIRDVLFIINRANTAICRNWPTAVATPEHRVHVEVEMAANTTDSATFIVIR